MDDAAYRIYRILDKSLGLADAGKTLEVIKRLSLSSGYTEQQFTEAVAFHRHREHDLSPMVHMTQAQLDQLLQAPRYPIAPVGLQDSV
jgi:hypothetical protein